MFFMDYRWIVSLNVCLCVSSNFLEPDVDVATSTEDSYIALKNDIFNRPVIKHKIPPAMYGQTTIGAQFQPIQILKVDEKHQFVTLSAVIVLAWSFPTLGWDPEDYSNISDLLLRGEDVWTPWVAVPNAGIGSPHIFLPKVIHLEPSLMVSSIPAEITVTCEFDMTFFPFDSHNCSIYFVEMTHYNLESADINSKSLTTFFSTTTEWLFGKSSCTSTPIGTQFYLKCWVTMERRSLFYILGVITPVLIIAFMTHFVFLIPVESGEKISYIVSLFVSIAIFISYVDDITPRSMNRVPHIISLLGAIMFNMVLSMLATFVVVRCYQRDLKRKERELAEKEERKMKERDDNTSVTTVPSIADLRAEGTDAQPYHTKRTDPERKLFAKFNGNQVHPVNGKGDEGGPNYGPCNMAKKTTPPNSNHRTSAFVATMSMWCSGITHDRLDSVFFVLSVIISCTMYSSIAYTWLTQ